MIRSGFTIVEIVITVAIMGILLTLAVVGLNATQANSRDAERKGDAENTVLNLEGFYSNQDPDIPFSGGGYPGTTQVSGSQITATLPSLDLKNVTSPTTPEDGDISLVAATNADPTPEGILPQPSASNDVYVYQPFTVNDTLCTSPSTQGECRRFNLFYFQETTNTVEVITSKHQ